MTDDKLYALLKAFTVYYWSVPVSYVTGRIMAWHPEVTEKQIKSALRSKRAQSYHFSVESEGLKEPEIAVEHLVAVDYDCFERFIAARLDLPYRDCDEQTLLRFDHDRLDIPEKHALIEFAREELGLDDKWVTQLVDDCILEQPTSLCDGKSWVMGFLRAESFGGIRFRTVEQVRRFRELGTMFYMAMPNPVLRGWKPSEIDNPPALPDDIPERDEDIPDARPAMETFFSKFDSREQLWERLASAAPKSAPKIKIGPNDPCPCGSGKKYKKCCGR